MEYIKFSNFITKTQYGYTAEATSIDGGDVKYLRITDIVPYFVDKDRVPYCKISDEKKKQYLVEKDDLLIARTGATTGYNLIVPNGFDNYIFASYLVRYYYRKEVLFPQYLKYVLKSKHYYCFVNNYIGGSAQPGMNPKSFGRFEVPYVDYESQKRIASVLYSYDCLIENNNKRIKALEKIAENLYKEWFVRFRFPGFENAEFENGIPKGWTHCRIKELFEIKYGKDHKSIAEGKIPIFGSGGIMRYGDKAIYSNESVLIPRKGTLNNILYVNEPFWTVDTMFYTILLKPNFAKYAYYTLANVDMESYNSGAALPSMTTDILYHLRILVPDNRTLKLFDEFLSDINIQKKRIEVINNNLTKQRDLLLPRLMSGKLEV